MAAYGTPPIDSGVCPEQAGQGPQDGSMKFDQGRHDPVAELSSEAAGGSGAAGGSAQLRRAEEELSASNLANTKQIYDSAILELTHSTWLWEVHTGP